MIPPFRRSGSKGAVIRRWRDVLLPAPVGPAELTNMLFLIRWDRLNLGHHAFHAPAHLTR
ncbi:hypothetical protein GCM10010869_05980 [Mesorhizobium tianshanense]|nr:hypothetical protein GCM10010869_05980 [Mesorhizobium tianshanense]